MKDDKEITFVRHQLYLIDVKFAQSFKKRGYKVNVITFYQIKKEFQGVFDKQYYLLKQDQSKLGKFRKFLKMPGFYRSIRKIQNSIFIGVSEPNWFVTMVFMMMGKKAVKKIYFPFDITFFRRINYKDNSWLERYSEKYNFKHCDGIMHKGPENELKNLPKEFEAAGKPSIQFLPYCDDSLIVKIDDDYFKNKLSKKDGETHLVYVGGVYYNNPLQFPAIDVFKEIVKQNLFLHVYSVNYREIKNDSEYKKLQKNKYFKLHKPIYSKDLQKELSKYDWGVVIFITNFEKLKKIWAETAFGNKTSNYLEAGLPNIVYSGLSFSAEVVKKNDFGIVIDDVKKISKAIEKTDYPGLIKKMIKSRLRFTIDKNIPRLEKFIEKI